MTKTELEKQIIDLKKQNQEYATEIVNLVSKLKQAQRYEPTDIPYDQLLDRYKELESKNTEVNKEYKLLKDNFDEKVQKGIEEGVSEIISDYKQFEKIIDAIREFRNELESQFENVLYNIPQMRNEL